MDKRAKARLPSSGSKLRWEREGAENTLRGEREQKSDKTSENLQGFRYSDDSESGTERKDRKMPAVI